MKHLSRLALFAILFLSGCSAQIVENFRSELPPEHQSYYAQQYEGANYHRARGGYHGIQIGAALLPAYDGVSELLAGADSASVGEVIETAYHPVALHIESYLTVWRSTINSGGDFGEAISAMQHEFNRLGITERTESLDERLKTYIRQYDESEHPHAYQAYGILSQLIAKAVNPTGSLMSYSNSVTELRSELDRELALAGLE